MAEAYGAEYLLLPLDDFAGAATLLDRMTHDAPEVSLSLGFRGDFLGRVGRMKDALEVTKRAVELDPLSPDTRADYVNALTYAGQWDAALKEVEKAEKIWPGSDVLFNARFRYFLRFGDPKEALRLMRPDDVAHQSLILARVTPRKKR